MRIFWDITVMINRKPGENNCLTRYLTTKEKVHHLNGVKNDNRLENLELVQSQSDHIKLYHLKNERFHSDHQKTATI